MPDLSNKGCHKLWHQYPDRSIYKTIAFMEGVENKTLDGDPKVEETMLELSKTLDNIGNIDIQDEEDFIKISTSLKIGRAVRLLQALDIAHPGAASQILKYAEENSSENSNANESFLKRNLIFERLRLFARIFSEDRFKDIRKALGEK